MTFEYCSSFGNAHPFVQYVLDSIKKLSNGLIHPCPYAPTSKIGIDQWTFNNNLSMPLIQQNRGDYKITIYCKDKYGKLIFYIYLHCLFTPKNGRKN